MITARAGTAAVITVVIPTFNESENIANLLERLDVAFQSAKVAYKVITVDDNSSDGTFRRLMASQRRYPLEVHRKHGERGKASSLLEGFRHVDTPYAAMLDADLQYPPEALPEMLKQIQSGTADIVVARRKYKGISILRRFTSFGFRTVFGRLLWGFKCDVQSGQKVFKAEILHRLQIDPQPWTFDLEFLVSCRSAGYRISEYPITFIARQAGSTDVHLIKTSLQVGYEALKLRIRTPHLIPFAADPDGGSHGFHYKGTPYQPHNKLHSFETAVLRFSQRQIVWGGVVTILLATGFIYNFHVMLAAIIGGLTILYFSDLLLNVIMVIRSYFFFEEEQVSDAAFTDRAEWPEYTIFCPLYKEAQILPQFTEAMAAMDYPVDKLEIQLLLEADDTETIAAAQAMDLPATFKIVVVPHALPKTKPKACNYGLNQATGEYAVIYDAEDIPDPQQLKKAVITFERSPTKIGCIQAKLNYYNWNQNLLTRLFTLEYTLWFNLVLPGLQSIHAPIPLGGTSNHFRVSDLRAVGGWDPFNVTEDADLGMRLAKQGFTTLILDSTTLEEANSQFWNWIRQRSRWIKGYIQTYFVHTRKLSTKQSPRDFLIFQLLIGGKVLSALINPLLWLLTILYFSFRGAFGDYIHSLYGAPIFYLALISLLIGNFLYFYIYMMAVAKREQTELILTTFAVPLYWLMMSMATVKAIYEFIVKPFHWQKTTHGLHLKQAELVPTVKPASDQA